MRRFVTAGALTIGLVLALPTPGTAENEVLSLLTIGAAQELGPTLPKPRLRRLRALADAASTHAYYWTPSPDGRWFSYVDWDTGNLARYSLETDESRDLTNKGTWADSEEFAEVSAISPDGGKIAFAWCCDPGYQLRLIDSDGSDERVLWAAAEDEWVYLLPAAWSPSGKELLVYLLGDEGKGPGASRKATARIFSPETGSSRVAWRFEGLPGAAQYSPDGRYVAYSKAREGPMAGSDDLFILDLENQKETALVSGPEDETFLGWSTDGKRVLFHGELGGSPSIWALPVTDGTRSGPPALVRRDVPGLNPAGAGSGHYFYTVDLEQPRLQTMALEIPGGKVLKAPSPVDELERGATGLSDWSPNGDYLAYIHFGTARWSDPGNLVIRSASGNHVRHLPLPDLNGRPRTLKWAPSGERVLVSGVDATGRFTRWIDLKSGKSLPVPGLENEVVWGGRIVFTGDGRYAFIGGISFEDRKVSRLDLESGEIETIFERPPVEGPWKGLAGVAISPDKKTLAVAFGDSVCLLPIEGGEPRWIFQETRPLMEGGGLIILGSGIFWTPDGKHLVATDGGSGPDDRAILVIPVEEGEPRRLEGLKGVRGVRLHPDGKRLAFSAGQYKSELWVMEFPD
jgi:Tol biopolymer transport system component